MNIMFDEAYNTTYPEKPKRIIVADEGFGPQYVTEDVIPAVIAKAKADIDRFQTIANWISAQGS